MKSVAIYGFAPQTRDLVNDSDAEEVWSLNNFYDYGLPEDRVTRTFEMHELWMAHVYAQNDARHRGQFYWDWMKGEHPFPIYLARVWDDFLAEYRRIKALDLDNLSEPEKELLGVKLQEIEIAYDFFRDSKADFIRYPLEDICAKFFPPVPGMGAMFPPGGVNPYFVSSIDYMSALAIYEGYERIEYYGVELKEKTEWAMQKSGATFWIAYALASGIEVRVPQKSVLIKAPLYGIETGAQMIPIQIPEELKMLLAKEFDMQRTKHNHLTGRYTSLADQYNDIMQSHRWDEVEELEKKREEIWESNPRFEQAQEIKMKMAEVKAEADEAYQKIFLSEGGMNAMRHLIKNEDLKLDPLTMESITRLEYIDDKEREVSEMEVS